MRLVVDIETDGLDVDTCKIWCIVAYNLDTEEYIHFRPDNLEDFYELCRAEYFYMHNGLAFDGPVLRNHGFNIPNSKIWDTLVLSRLYFPDREGHSLEAWGKKLGYPKIEFNDFSQFSEDMLTYCQRDVEVTTRVLEHLNWERGDHDWELAEKIEHKVAEILFEQERNGWKFDLERAKHLVEWLDSEINRVENKMDFGKYYQVRGYVRTPFLKSGGLTKQVLDWTDEDVVGPFTKIEWYTIELSQRDKVANKLMEMGWEPTSYTEKGRPQLTPNKEPCPNLVKMGEIGQDIAYYSLCSHRKGQIQGWVDNCREDGRVPSIAIGNSTNTARMAHRVIANVPKASEKVFLGPEMRGLFVCEPGNTIVGWDMEGLELRVLAHYMDDPDFTEAVVNGSKEDETDIHNVMLRAADGLIPDRDTEKNCLYCIVYGGGDWKLGSTAGYTKGAKEVGKKIRERWNSRFPKLPQLVEKVSKASERGYLKAIDGRKIWMRRDPTGKVMSHKGLNTLIQATGSILVKTTVAYLHHEVERKGVDAHNLIIYHDENQAEVKNEWVDAYEKLCYSAVKKVEKRYGLKCPLSIEVKRGQSWAECH